MTALLELPEIRQRVSPMSLEDYHRLGEYNANGKRTELIRGIVLEKMSKSPLHASLIKWLYNQLSTLVPPGFIVRFDNPLTLADSEPEPDIAVVRGADRDFFTAHPTTAALVIEVCVSSATLDRAKAAIYAEANIPECWLVLASEQWRVEVHRQPSEGRYQDIHNYYPGDVIECASVPNLRLPVSNLLHLQ